MQGLIKTISGFNNKLVAYFIHLFLITLIIYVNYLLAEKAIEGIVFMSVHISMMLKFSRISFVLILLVGLNQ